MKSSEGKAARPRRSSSAEARALAQLLQECADISAKLRFRMEAVELLSRHSAHRFPLIDVVVASAGLDISVRNLARMAKEAVNA